MSVPSTVGPKSQSELVCNRWRLIAKVFWVAAAFVAVLGVMVYVSWISDRNILLEIATRESSSADTMSERIRDLNRFVYGNQGFAKNKQFFVISRLGPTPVQVLNAGGDCSDKSRLLSALLDRIDIDSTLAMLYPCADCLAGHTVVEARYQSDELVLDPVFDVDFPDPRGGFLGLEDLSKDHEAVVKRIRELRQVRGSHDKINKYDYEQHSYRVVRTVNWTKNWMTRMIGDALETMGYNPFLVRRPHLLEDPKLLLSFTSLLICLALIGAGAGCWIGGRNRS